jgi:hypothetical protein
MHIRRFLSGIIAAAMAVPALRAQDPRITSWYTALSGKYARIFQTAAAETAGTSVTTWSRGAGTQTLPTYSGVHEVSYSPNWVYLRTTGLAGHVMGPWYLDAAKTQNFPNFPSNTATIYRIPRAPAVPATKTLTDGGAIGFFVNGVAFFDNRDTFSYSNANGTDASPVGGIGQGDGIWNRDALPNEGVTFDAALAHQAGNQYHYHVQPIALRYQLGDHVDYNATTNRYSESAGPVAKHSPIIAWAQDGYPVYGPYGYSSAMDASSGLRRMVSGYVPRNGANGTTNLNTAGRHTLPAWAAAAQNRSATLATNQYGPNVSATYAIGHYLEDNDYLGDLGFVQGVAFDLDRYNGRTCVTPEFPNGTYAYFSAINADATPAFPYNIGRQFYGSPTGGTVTSIGETVTTAFSGGSNAPLKATNIVKNAVSGETTVTWSSVDGGTYKVEKTSDLAVVFTDLQTGIASSGIFTSLTESAASQAGATQRFYRVSRTALANYDTNGFPGGGSGGNSVAPGGSAARGTTVTVTITLPSAPPQPPANLVPTSVTLAGTIAGTGISRPAQGTVIATFAIPAGAPTGAQTIVIVFNPAPTYTMTAAFTIL